MSDYTGKAVAYNGHPLYEGRPVGQFADPMGTTADLVFNGMYDMGDMFHGLNTMGNAATARFYEGVPTPQNHWQMQPWIRPQQDFNTAKQMGAAIIGNYQHSYVDPIAQGRPQDLVSHFVAHPINSLLDINGVAQLTGAPRAMAKAFAGRPKAAQTLPVGAQPIAPEAVAAPELASPIQPIKDLTAKQEAAAQASQQKAMTKAAAEAAQAAKDVALAKAELAVNRTAQSEAKLQSALNKQTQADSAVKAAMNNAQQATSNVASADGNLASALQRVEELKNKLLASASNAAQEIADGSKQGKVLIGAVDKMVPITPAGKKAAQLSGDFAAGVVAEDTKLLDDLGRLWNDIPKYLRDEVKVYAEGWHPKLLAGGKMPASIAKYLKRAEDYSAIMRDRIRGFANNVDLDLDKYQPAALRLQGLNTEQWQALSRVEQLDVLRFAKGFLESKGITPQYSPYVLPGEAGNTIRNPATMQGYVSKSLEDSSKAGFLKSKQSTGEKAIKSHFDAMRTRWIQISQFQQAYEKILESAIDMGQQLDILTKAPEAAANQIAKNVREELLSQQAIAEQLVKNAAEDLANAKAVAADHANKLAEAEAAAQAAELNAVKANERLLKAQGAQSEAEAMALELEAKAAEAAKQAAKARRDAVRKEAEAKKAAADLSAQLEAEAQKALDAFLKDEKTLEQQMKAHGYQAISGQALVESVLGPLQGSVIQPDELAQLAKRLIPGDIYLPTEFIRAIEQAAKNNSFSSNWILRTYDKANTFAKRYQLGGNPTYGLAQTAQAMMMLELVSLNGIRSTVTSVLSYGLALSPKFRKAVPLSIAEDVIGSTVSTQRYLENAVDTLFNQPVLNKTPGYFQAPVRNMVGIYENFVDFNLKAGMLGDSFIRAKAGIQHALMIAQENTPLGQSMRDMFDTTKLIGLVENTFANDAQKMAVAQKVNDALGNFRAISEQSGMKTLGRITPYPAWQAFITEYTLKLPVNHPYKTILMNNIAQLQEKYVADKNVPNYLKGTVKLSSRGPNGLPQVMSKAGMNPLTSLPQMLEIVQSLATGQGDESALSLATAPIQLAFMLTTRLNPQTLKDFDDPSLVKVGDKQYTRNDVLRGNIAKGIAQPQRPLPDPISLSLRAFFSVQERWAETLLEKLVSGGQRSQMSTPFHSAPKLDKRTGQKRKSNDWITMLINLLVNAQPVEYDPSAVFIEQRANNQAQKQATRALMRRDQ